MFTARIHSPAHMYRLAAMPIAFFGALVLTLGLGACNNDPKPSRQYCDQTGCYACMGDQCYPIPGNPTMPPPGQVTTCDNDSACGDGNVCNLGTCQAGCKADGDCQSGYTCISGRCRPGGSATCGVAGAYCTAGTNCGTSRSCVAGACASACTDASKCVLGQVCSNGACIEDPAPQASQCQYNMDCGGGSGFRCINAYCLKNCAASTDCDSGAACVKGACRADRRPS